LCIFVLPLIIKDEGEGSAEMAYVLFGILTIMYNLANPFLLCAVSSFYNLEKWEGEGD
jgi:hypothetical protein